MESTSKYWIPIYNVLEEEMDICLAHPKYVKAIRGKQPKISSGRKSLVLNFFVTLKDRAKVVHSLRDCESE